MLPLAFRLQLFVEIRLVELNALQAALRSIEREPAPETFFSPGGTGYSSMDDFKARGGKLFLCCGFPGGEMIYNQPGYSISWTGNSGQWSGWDSDTYYCRQNWKEFGFQVGIPAHAAGTLRLYIIDPDNFDGGRKESVVVGDKTIGTYDHFQEGRWIEAPVGSDETADGKLNVRILNAKDNANAVLSKIEWVEKE